MKLPLLIGSMPHKEPKNAVELILTYLPHSPCWPQLPKRGPSARWFKEQMVPQYSENFPGIIVDEINERVVVDEEKFYLQLEEFYNNYINKNIDYFKISQEYASGFYEFVNQLSNLNYTPQVIKFQTTGPITFGFIVKTFSGQAIFYNDQYREIILNHIVMKSLWQLYQVCSLNLSSTYILFLDEPYLTAYGSAFTAVSREEIVTSLSTVINEIKRLFKETVGFKNNSILLGIHCCANTDWSILTDLPIDIISFDAYDYFSTFMLYSENIKTFISRDGILSWGIVPNNEKLYSETISSIKEKLNKNIEILIDKGVEKDKILNNIIITPQCGLANSKEKVAEEVLKFCSQLIVQV